MRSEQEPALVDRPGVGSEDRDRVAPLELRRTVGVATLILVAVAVILRCYGVLTDFWLDEIWSLNLTQDITSPLEIVTSLHTDNNHILNTLYLFVLGEREQWWAYRIPPLLASCGSLYLAWLLVKSAPWLERMLVVCFFSFSYLFILYGTEARGYAYMLFFMFAGWVILTRYSWEDETPSIATLAAWWIVCCLGVLSHLTFLHFFGAAVLWTLMRPHQNSKRSPLLEMFRLHLIPVLFILVVYFSYVRNIPQGTGPLKGSLEVILDVLSLSFGGPELAASNGMLGFIVALVIVILLAIELGFLFFERSERWILFTSGILLAPCLSLLVYAPRVIFIRYFLVSLTFAYFVLASLLNRMWQKSVGGKVFVISAMLLFFTLNGRYIVDFLQYGRGGYYAALDYIQTESASDQSTILSDHDFRNSQVIEYYSRFFPKHTFTLVSTEQSNQADVPDWILLHQITRTAPPNEAELPRSGYHLAKVFPHAALSGWTWYLYRRVPSS